MAAIVLAAAVTCFVALFLGQAVLRLAGAERWNWLAPPVGLSLALLVATPANHVPGRCATVAVVLGVASIAAAVWCLRSPAHRSPLLDLLAAAPVGVLVLVPFLSAGRGGILGVGLNNDMAVHLVFVESYLSSAVAAVNPLPADYPLGPHVMAALLSKGLGIRAELAFSGWTMAIPLIIAWTSLAAARRASLFGKVVLATVVGMPFLITAYYGQGSFKELAQAGFVLAVVLALGGFGPRLGRGRWVPIALLAGGIVSVFSLPGLPWLLVIGGIWLAGLLTIEARGGGLREVPGIVRRELPALGIGLGVVVVVLLPQAHRMWEFISLRSGTGIAVSDIGNLIGPLSGWEAFGVWGNPDFRLPASPAFTAGMWTAFALGLVLYGAIRAFRRGRWLLPLAAAGSMLIWRVSEHSQSPYVSAKALVVASPLLLLVAVWPLIDRQPGRRQPRVWLLVPLLGLLLLLRVGIDDVRALRYSAPVGPTDHARQLESLRPLLAGKPTLFLGGEVFIDWELAGVPVQPVALADTPVLPLRPRKGWEDGQALDFDSLRAATLNDYEWIVTPRDAADSEPPPQLHLVRSSEDFELWKRVGRIRERSILAEGEWPGRELDCEGPEGREILAGGGVAAVRSLPRVAPMPPGVAPRETVSVPLNLPVGRWELQLPYTSPYPVQVTAPGLTTVLPANLDRPGPRLRVGRLVVRRQRPFSISFHVGDTALAPAPVLATFGNLVIVPAGGRDRIVPIAQACGEYVDWYRSAAS